MSATIPRAQDNQESFPRALLEGCTDALVLFAAAFNGAQDAVWVHDAGLTATCVDVDGDALNRMRDLYPEGWTFLRADAFWFCEEVGGQWDVVTVDCPTNEFPRCADRVGLWCRCARKAVVLGTGVHTTVEPPVGWEITDRRRRSNYDGGVYWTVLERATT